MEQSTFFIYTISMEGNSIGLITKYNASGKGIDDVFRKTKVFDLEKENTLKNLFGLDRKEKEDK